MGAWWLIAIGTLITGCCYGIQRFLQWTSYRLPARVAYYNDGIAYYFKTLLILLFIRSFIVEWSIVPSDSLKPTLLAGDRVLTDKSVYGIRLPVTGHVLIPLNKPKRGEIIVFRCPVEPSKGLIKRLIGLPGDRVQYRDKQLTINGKCVPQIEKGIVYDQEAEGKEQPWLLCEENLEGCLYQIYLSPHPETSVKKPLVVDKPIDITVPPEHYFVMGDHRDHSIDSRVWDCIPDRYLLGKAKRIYMSHNKPSTWWKPYSWMRWKRIFMRVK
jgi:signal peptidase I